MNASPSIVAVGVFDGLHLGHQALIHRLVDEARERSLRPVVITFSSHPGFVLGRRSAEMWLDEEQERVGLLREMGVEEVVVMDFTPKVSDLSACEFVEKVLVPHYGMQALLLGYDTRFGNRSRDDFDQLPQLAERLGLDLVHDQAILQGLQPISSTRIRAALNEGDMVEAESLFGRPYSLFGRVVEGRKVGRLIGFPTANVDLSQCRKLVPKEGVYAVTLRCNGGQWKGMANLGSQPTFGLERPVLEVHLLDFNGDLYGQQVEVLFLRRLRDIVRFASREALIAQLNKDKESLL